MMIKTKSFTLAVNTKGSKTAKKLALALPGRLDTKDYACFNSHLEYLFSRGFFAVSFDPPGTWESPGSIELFTTTNYIKAVNELIEYFGNKPTFLLGHSRGGQVSMLAGATNRSVVSFASINGSLGTPTPPSLKNVNSRVIVAYRDLPPGISKTTKQQKLHLSLNYFEDGKKYDVYKVLTKCTKPKLFLYGVRDEYTAPKEIKELFNMIPEPKELHWLDSNHDYRYYPEVIDKVNKKVGEFLDRY